MQHVPVGPFVLSTPPGVSNWTGLLHRPLFTKFFLFLKYSSWALVSNHKTNHIPSYYHRGEKVFLGIAFLGLGRFSFLNGQIRWHTILIFRIILISKRGYRSRLKLVHPEGPRLEGRRPERSRAASALVVLVMALARVYLDGLTKIGHTRGILGLKSTPLLEPVFKMSWPILLIYHLTKSKYTQNAEFYLKEVWHIADAFHNHFGEVFHRMC